MSSFGSLRRRTVCLAAAFPLLGALAITAQQAVLVRDLRPGIDRAASPNLYEAVGLGGRVVFGADDGVTGVELWSTDGTASGTQRIADLCPGPCSGTPTRFVVAGDQIFFYAVNSLGRTELWRTDGTEDGTHVLPHPEIDGFGGSYPLQPSGVRSILFAARTRRERWALWSSDGTVAGTRKVAPLPGDPELTSGELNPLFTFDGRLFFTWTDDSDSSEIWESDGTREGTRPTERFEDPSYCGQSAVLGDALLFSGGPPSSTACALWRLDRGSRRARLLRKVPRGGPQQLTVAGELAYFVAAEENGNTTLWRTDGTPQGTRRAYPSRVQGAQFPVVRSISLVGTLGSRVLFVEARDGVGTLWSARGGGAERLMEVPFEFHPLFRGGSLYFTLGEGEDLELWRTRGTVGSTQRVLHSFRPCGNGLSFTLSSRLFLEVEDDRGCELAWVDENAPPTERLRPFVDLAHPARSSSPRDLTALPEHGLVFRATSDDSRFTLWSTDGRRATTTEIADLSFGDVGRGDFTPRLFEGASGAFFLAEPRGESQVFGWTDGRTVRVLPIDSSHRILGMPFGLEGRTLWFVERERSQGGVGLDLVVSDGTVGGTTVVGAAADLSGPASSFAVVGAAEAGADHWVYLVRRERPVGVYLTSPLMTTDGTAEGTREFARLPIESDEVATDLLVEQGQVYLWLASLRGSRLWTSMGTSESTREIARFEVGSGGLVAAGESLFFVASEDTHGRELWAVDKATAETRLVADLAAGGASSDPILIAALGERLIFTADDRRNGRELWTSDGTAAGTQRIDLRPGPRESAPFPFTRVGERWVFAADDGVHGLEPWISDGTPKGTHLLVDVEPGVAPSNPSGFVVAPSEDGDQLYFQASREPSGAELWRLPITELDRR